MSPPVDSAIVDALGLDSSSAKLQPHGASGFSCTFRVTGTNNDGDEKVYFVKTGTGPDAEVMFRGEHTSLNAIASIVPSFCPKSYAHGPLASHANTHFLATDFLDLSRSASSAPGSGLSLAAKLARLHMTPAPVPDGFTEAVFGFPVPTCCGATVQDNTFRSSWADFYRDQRLRAIVREGVRKNGSDKELEDMVERVVTRVVPRLLGEEHLKRVKPVVVHGDLWSGNHGRGRIGKEGTEEVVFDPAGVYGSAEYELGIMRMFGGFGGSFWTEYEGLVERLEPKGEWEDRVKLYELYHHLNHFALFGGGYRSGAMGIMRGLVAKYGGSK